MTFMYKSQMFNSKRPICAPDTNTNTYTNTNLKYSNVLLKRLTCAPETVH